MKHFLSALFNQNIERAEVNIKITCQHSKTYPENICSIQIKV